MACSTAEQEKPILKISVASSLIDVINEIKMSYKRETGQDVEMTIGSSSINARQIREGRDSSLFLSANRQWMDYLDDLYIKGTDQIILQNSLAVVVPLESRLYLKNIKELTLNDISTIAMGDPSHVPVGLYGKEFLQKLNLWKELGSKIVGAFDARAALSLVETASVDCGIVYKTDALASDKVKIILNLSPVDDLEINYIVSRFDDNPGTIAFYDFLFSEKSRVIFQNYGFIHNNRDTGK